MANENKELKETLKYYKETEKEDVELSKILKYANFFTSNVKQNAAWGKAFTDIFRSKEAFVLDIKNENLKKVSRDLLEFILQTFADLEEIAVSTNSTIYSKDQVTTEEPAPAVRRNTIPLLNKDITKIHNESGLLAQNISAQKLKILKIYDSVKESLNRSKTMRDTHVSPSVQVSSGLEFKTQNILTKIN